MYLGDFLAGETVDFKWNTTAVGTGSITRATNGSIRIYKNESLTQRSSAAGITDTEDFDSLTGLHHLTIDLSDDTDAGFYVAGSDYAVVIEGMIVDGETFNAALAHFSIENRSNLSAAQVNAEADQALADYDGPTNTEMVARTIAAASYATATAQTTAQNDLDLLTGADGAVLAASQPNYAPATAASLATTDGKVDDILTDTGTTIPGTIAALQATADAIETDTQDIQSTLAGLNDVSAGEVADAVWTEAIADHGGVAGSTAEALANAGAAGTPPTVEEIADEVETRTIARVTLVDTVTVNTDMRGTDNAATAADLATLDGKADDIKAKTDSLAFTVAGQVDSNIQYVNDVEVAGVGTEATPWGPA
jgi:hypothetical protein